MQPDPLVFLPALRREMLRPDLFTTARETGLAPFLMQRGGEALLHLELRQTDVPRILRGLRSPQRALLKRAVALLDAAGLERPPALLAAQAARVPRGEPGEPDIAYYEALVSGIADGIGVLSAAALSPSQQTDLTALCRSATRLEARMRSQYREALASLRAAIDAGESTRAPDPEPTAEQLTGYLRRRFPEHPDVTATNLWRLPGDNAQEIYFCDLAGFPGWEGPVVLRRASPSNTTGASLADEFLLLNHAQRLGLPVPRILFAERDTSHLGSQFSMMERLQGKARTPDQFGSNATGIVLEMARTLARLHQLEAADLPPPYTWHGESHAALMLARVDDFYARWKAGRIESSLMLESAFAWMRTHVDCLQGPVVLVHGDCNHRNWLLDGDRVSALLDWELAHLGHPAEDLAYIRPDVERIMPWRRFIKAYRDAGGRAVSDRELGYLNVWTNVWRTAMATWVYSGYSRGQHRSFIYASVSHNEYHVNIDALGDYMTRQAYRW